MKPEQSREAPPVVEIEIVPELEIGIVKLRGEHDLTTKRDVSEALAEAVECAPLVLVDLSECTFADSSLMHVLVEARARVGDGPGTIGVLIPPSATAVRRLAGLAALTEVVSLYESRADAIDDNPARREALS